MGDLTKASPAQVVQAAELLGVDVYDLGRALRKESHNRYMAEANRVTSKGGRPDMRTPTALLQAAEACERASDEATRTIRRRADR